MVYCHKCGTKNEDDDEFCSKCGSPLKGDSYYSSERHHRHRDGMYRQRNECFGLPHGGLIVGLFFGVLLILFGISSIFGFDIWMYIFPIVVVILGILIIVGAFYSYSRRS